MTELYGALLEREASRYELSTGEAGQSFLERFDIALDSALTRLHRAWSRTCRSMPRQRPGSMHATGSADVKRRADLPAELRNQIGTLERNAASVARRDKSHLNAGAGRRARQAPAQRLG